MSRLQTNAASISATPYRKTHQGTEYLIVPVVAIRQGVLNGEFVSGEEIGKYVDSWCGIPVTNGHPKQGGEFVSANKPDIVAVSPGRFYNAYFEDGGLKGEMWLDIGLAERIGGDALLALERFENGGATEVSTGYYRDLERKSGMWNGRRYNGIQHNIRPDHLAILLYEEGACNWQDGCGAPRVNQRRQPMGLVVNQEGGRVTVSLYPSEEDARRLALSGDGALPWEDLRLVLADFGAIEEQWGNQGDVLYVIGEYAGTMPVVAGTISGVARTYGEEQDTVVALFESSYLNDWRATLAYWLEGYGFYSSDSFTPYILLATLAKDAETPAVALDNPNYTFQQLALAWAESITLFDLQGEVRVVEATEPAANQRGGWIRGLLRRWGRSSDNGPTTQEEVMGEEQRRGTVTNGRPCPEQPQVNQADLAALVTNAVTEGLAALDIGAVVKAAVDERFAPYADTLTKIQSDAQATRDGLVQKLAANERVLFNADELAGMTLEQLQRLDKMAQAAPANYAGRNLRAHAGDDVETELAPPPLFAQAGNGNGKGE